MLYLIDSSAWILALRAGKNESAGVAVSKLLDEDTAATCSIVMLELLSGVASKSRYDDLLADLEALHVIPTTENIWNAAFRLAFTLRGKGLTIPATDALIAAAALESGCGVLHADRHFDMIAKHTSLRTVNVFHSKK